MADKLSLYNGALFKFKQRKIASLTATDPPRYALDAVYDKVVQFMLEAGAWNFAQRTIAIEPSVDIQPEFGWDNAFEVPDDFVRLIGISSNPMLYPPLVANQFAYEGNVWLANAQVLYVSYVSNGSLYGLNLGNWPETFAEAVEWELCKRIAPPMSNATDGEMDRIEAKAKTALRNARTKDALNQAGQNQPPGALSQARRNFRTNTLWNR